MKTLKTLLWFVILAAGFFAGVSWNKMDTISESTNEPSVVLVSNSDETSADIGIDGTEMKTIRLFEKSAPSVCFITTSNVRRDFFNRNIMEVPRGTGSGFVWDKEGHIVTNYHVIQGADKAQVTLADHSSWEASLVGVAPEKDLAVLEINAPRDKLAGLPVGESDNLRVGQTVLAIGNPFGLDQSLTTGIVSALGREIESVAGTPIRGAIQTDAAINPGNSGGPLLDSSGRLIGVNTAIYSPSGASAGIGFSIPVDVVKWVVPELIQYGKINRPSMGIEFARPLRNITGALVYDVVEGGPAEKAGIKPTMVDRFGNVKLGDIIIGVGAEKISSSNEVNLALENYKVGEEITVTLLRDEKKMEIKLQLAESQ
ncbi:MAG: trypsin-like peptidase domain-containing protein [Saprospiraceae bacterium]|nr:trypsin-like peptidase domain-containing protein [Saprospiraceae bacterium]MCB9323604.1 trypsin-like peptidase domain-containing protein [Lewinellaceae bacterium]